MESVVGTGFINVTMKSDFPEERWRCWKTEAAMLWGSGAVLFGRRRGVVFEAKGGESCVAVKEGFADEEDYVKAGGSELYFVQMQQSKSMGRQSRTADKVRFRP